MEDYFLNKIEELQEELDESINKAIELIENNSFGANDDEIDECIKEMNRIEKEIKTLSYKIPENLQKNYFIGRIDYLKEKETEMKKALKNLQGNNFFDSNRSVIDFLEELIKENRKSQNQIENSISNIIQSTNINKNDNKQSLNVNISPTISPHFEQIQFQSVNIEIQNLIEEFESEVSKPKPDIKKVETLGDRIIKKAPQFLPFINLIISILKKFGVL